ncbi:hypothetical protein BKA69DRAFT_408674 [Paraphysoderma sedebokerense]|nr:hypothetical protein BKA69DRAFT_408674 [Paraphysoderma sedebokerense]
MNHHHNHSHNHHHHNHLPPPVISLLSSSDDESSDDDDDIQIVSVTQPSRPLAVVLDDDDDDDDDIEIVSVKLAPTPSRPYHRSPSLTAPPSKFPKFSKSSSTRNSTFPPNSLLNSPSRESPLKIEKNQPPTPNEPIDLDTPPEPQPPPLVIPPVSLYPSGLQLSKHQDFNNVRFLFRNLIFLGSFHLTVSLGPIPETTRPSFQLDLLHSRHFTR